MKARTIKRRENSDELMPREPQEPKTILKRVKPNEAGEPLADQVACSKQVIKNYKWAGAEKDFPTKPQHRHVDKFYPFAMQGKGLLIDEPMYADAIKFCEEVKKPLFEKKGLRYLIIKKETTLEQLLEETSQWHGPRS